MHSPESVAFEIYLGKKKKKNGHYREPIITIWHKDPCTDGTDDSCGWFIRLRHADKELYEKIVKEFSFYWDNTHKGENGHIYYNGWFNEFGENVLSVQGVVFNMYVIACKEVFKHNKDISPQKMWKLTWRFIAKHRDSISWFAENTVDSMRDIIVRKYAIGTNTPYDKNKMIEECASIIYTDILRKNRKWYQHPKWHIKHWEIKFNFLQRIKRRYSDKCSVCGKRGFKSSAYSDWNGTKIWHQECDTTTKKG